jgi:pimeloyl-ACP methyl ester carboxylesterase
MTETIGQLTAPNLRVEAANGVRYVYRRFGNAKTSALPLLMLIHYRANLDNWDPTLVDALAQEREVVLIDDIGVAGSSGMTPSTVGEMALGVIAFTDALDLYSYDLLGFSLGGFVAQEVAMRRPYAARRLVLAGTGPEGGRDMHVYSGRIRAIAVSDEPAIEDLLTLFFEDTATSQARGQEFLKRIQTSRTDRDKRTDLATRDAQLSAISTWGIPDPTRLNRLAAITQPVLVANGDNDRMVPTENTHLLAQHLPNATLRIYPDAGHGFLCQYPAEFAAEVNAFLGR